MFIRKATIQDARRIAEIHVLAWQSAYRGIMPDSVLDGLDIEKRTRGWTRHLTEASENAIVAENNEKVIGWATYGPCRNDDAKDSVEVYGIYLDPEYVRQGIGRAMWRSICHEFSVQNHQRVAVWVLAANEKSRKFYEAMGGLVDPSVEKIHEQSGAGLKVIRYWCPTSMKS